MSQTIDRFSAPAPRSHLPDSVALDPPSPRSLSERALRIAVVAQDGGLAAALAPPARARGWTLVELSAAAAAPPPGSLGAVLADVRGAAGDDGGVAASAQRAARAAGAAFIVCAPRAEPQQRVRALRAGADGWIELPCHPDEVVARVRAIVRGGEAQLAAAPAGTIHAGELAIRGDRWQAYAGDAAAGLTTREYELLELLARHGGEVLARERIYGALWGGTMARGDRVVDVFVSRVRLKLERISPGWRYIETQSGVGYRFSPGVAEPLFATAASSSTRSA